MKSEERKEKGQRERDEDAGSEAFCVLHIESSVLIASLTKKQRARGEPVIRAKVARSRVYVGHCGRQ